MGYRDMVFESVSARICQVNVVAETKIGRQSIPINKREYIRLTSFLPNLFSLQTTEIVPMRILLEIHKEQSGAGATSGEM